MKLILISVMFFFFVSCDSGNYASGTVTFPDGKPLTGDIQEIHILISGVSDGGEKVSYSPIVKDGKFKQKLASGQYRFERSWIKVRFNEQVFSFDLAPEGSNASKTQSSADGITQNFFWKVTGVNQTYGQTPNPNNHTHWHGMSIGMGFDLYRNDINKPTVRLPAGTKLEFKLMPTSKCIDGSTLQEIFIQREIKDQGTYPNDDLNDLPPANYEMVGTAVLPDGTSKPILFRQPGDYNKYSAKGIVTLQVDKLMIGGVMNKPLFAWIVE